MVVGLAVLGAAVLTGGGSAAAEPAGGAELVDRVRRALGPAVVVRETERGPDWVRVQLVRTDEAYPVAVDVLVGTGAAPRRTAYLLPGGGLNFAANFFTPRVHNLAHDLRRQGYLVIGVTPREDSLPALSNDPVAGGWGLAAHRRDLAAVAAVVNRVTGLPHDVLGHSAGAALALSYAGTGPAGLGRVLVLDTTGPFDPVAEADLRQRAAQSRDVVAGLLGTTHAVDTANARRTLLRAVAADPLGDSGVARPAGGTFTWAGLLHFQLIRTRDAGGVFNWIYEPSVHAGEYAFGAAPAQDAFALRHATVALVAEATDNLGSGMLPTALLRDLFALWSGDAGLVDWAGIEAPVTWVNMGEGRGDHPYGARPIAEGGNPDVTFTVVPGYGHGDPVWGVHADRDVWPLLRA
ncbi:hypothetical protein WEI85_20570 [Actinomycetes bacterium KLBMP 9797]